MYVYMSTYIYVYIYVCICVHMPETYCGPCGLNNQAPVNDLCRERQPPRRSTRATGKDTTMADVDKVVAADVKPVINQAGSTTDDEERAITGSIWELERKKKLIELERKERVLREEMQSLTSEEHSGNSRRRTRSRRRSPSQDRRWRGCHCHSSSSSSSSREHKARSKWSLLTSC